MNVKDVKAYEEWKANNTDPYGLEIFRYAERWADMMEKRIANGEKIDKKVAQ